MTHGWKSEVCCKFKVGLFDWPRPGHHIVWLSILLCCHVTVCHSNRDPGNGSVHLLSIWLGRRASAEAYLTISEGGLVKEIRLFFIKSEEPLKKLVNGLISELIWSPWLWWDKMDTVRCHFYGLDKRWYSMFLCLLCLLQLWPPHRVGPMNESPTGRIIQTKPQSDWDWLDRCLYALV